MKKLKGISAALLAAAVAMFAAACATPGAAMAETDPAALQAQGSWTLLEHSTSGVGAFGLGHELWAAVFYLDLNPDGTFSEINFWTPEFTATGTWELSGSTLTLSLGVRDAGGFPFVATRALTLSPDGEFLTMEYSRPQWDYSSVFMRSPARDGVAAVIVANNSPYFEDDIGIVIVDGEENVVAIHEAVAPGYFVTFTLIPGDYAVVVVCSIDEGYAYPLQNLHLTDDIATTRMSGTVRLNFTGRELLRN